MEKDIILELKNVSKKYKNSDYYALKNVSLEIEEGKLISIIGASGAGKSTLLRTINRMIEPDSGEILFDNRGNILEFDRSDLKRARRRIGMIFQHHNLVNRLSCLENVLHGRLGYKNTLEGVLGRYTEEEKKKSFELLDMLGIGDQSYKKARELSGGQRQRVGIARALNQDPKMILCDEPIASLDPNSSKVIMDHLHDITKSGITCICNLHQVDVALNYSDYVVGLKKGEVVFFGTPKELTEDAICNIYDTKPGELIME